MFWFQLSLAWSQCTKWTDWRWSAKASALWAWEHRQMKADWFDTKLEKDQKTESLYMFRWRNNNNTWSSELNQSSHLLRGSSATPAMVFIVHRGDEEEIREGWRQLQALGCETRLSLGDCRRAGWSGPQVVHFQGSATNKLYPNIVSNTTYLNKGFNYLSSTPTTFPIRCPFFNKMNLPQVIFIQEKIFSTCLLKL